MSSAIWRQHFSYVILKTFVHASGALKLTNLSTLSHIFALLLFSSFNKYSQITARAVRQSLKETERVKAEKRGLTILRYQKWENGKGGEQVSIDFSSSIHLRDFMFMFAYACGVCVYRCT